MSFEIRFTVEAEETYEAIYEQLHSRWGEKITKEFEEGFQNL